jgi:hypothetical protein
VENDLKNFVYIHLRGGRLWDVELLDKNILIVSFQERPYLQFVDVIKRKLRKEIKIDEPKRGIAVHSNQIILSSKSKISVIDLSGNEKYNFISLQIANMVFPES